MIKAIPTSSKEMNELLPLFAKRGILSDAETARDIYEHYMRRYRVPGSPVFTFDSALGTIFRMGYTLGQRRERARRAASNSRNKKARNDNVQR